LAKSKLFSDALIVSIAFCLSATMAVPLFPAKSWAQDNSLGSFFDKLKHDLNNSLVGPRSGNQVDIPIALRGIFANAPFQDNAPLSAQYPHVAFTVISYPANHSLQVGLLATSTATQVPRACWTLQATIWTSKRASTTVPDFEVCNPDMIMLTAGVPHAGFDKWLIFTRYPTPGQEGQTTGLERTIGPQPPATPFPAGVAFTAYFGGDPPLPTVSSEEGWMWSSLLYRMGFDWNTVEDRRVWVYKYLGVN